MAEWETTARPGVRPVLTKPIRRTRLSSSSTTPPVHLLRFCYANTTTLPLRLRTRNLRLHHSEEEDDVQWYVRERFLLAYSRYQFDTGQPSNVKQSKVFDHV
jgi:hypothetical protein